MPGNFVYTPAAGTVLDAGPGQTLSVDLHTHRHADYNPAYRLRHDQRRNKATPTITWANPADITYGTALSATQLDATASVPGIFATPRPGTVLHAGPARRCRSPSRPPTPIDYNPATTSATINVQKATPLVTWANPAAIAYGTALSATQLDATAILPGSFVYTPATGTVLAAGAGQTLAVTFTPTDTVDYNTVTDTASINVTKAQLTVAANNQSMTYGGPVPAFSYTITGFVNGDHASVVSGTPLLTTTASQSSRTGSYPIAVNVTQLSATNYTFAGQNGTLDHQPGHADYHLGQPRRHHLRHGAIRHPARRHHDRARQLRYTPAAGTVLSAGAGQTLSVSFTPTDTADYIR